MHGGFSPPQFPLYEREIDHPAHHLPRPANPESQPGEASGASREGWGQGLAAIATKLPGFPPPVFKEESAAGVTSAFPQDPDSSLALYPPYPLPRSGNCPVG